MTIVATNNNSVIKTNRESSKSHKILLNSNNNNTLPFCKGKHLDIFYWNSYFLIKKLHSLLYSYLYRMISSLDKYYFKKLRTNKIVLFLFKLMTHLKHITVDPTVYEKLRNLGKTSDSFNDVLKNFI